MSASSQFRWTGLPVRIVGSVFLLIVLVLLMRRPEPAGPGGPDDPGNEKPVVTTTEDSQCTRDLTRIVDGMRPGRLGVNVNADDLVSELNRWFTKCGGSIQDDLTFDLAPQAALIPEELLGTLERERFQATDVSHIRFCILADEIAETRCAQLPEETQRVLQLFQFVVRYLAPLSSASQVPRLNPLPYELLLWGEGTPEDRAWVFGELLRQLRLDAVIITPVSQPENWLVGVPVSDVGVLLFDVRLGLPIPGTHDDETAPFPTAAATLAEARTDDLHFRKLDLPDAPYALRSSDMNEIRVELIASPLQWSPRMARFQFMVAPFLTTDFFDGLVPNPLRPGNSQIERLSLVGEQNQNWSAEQLSVWQYPLLSTQAATRVEGENLELQTLKMQIFSGPHLPKLDSRTGQMVIRAADETLHAVRVEQLKGDHQAALLHFGPILTSFRTNPTPLNVEASNYAALWIGISQFETQKHTAAINTFDRFISTGRQSQTQLVPLDEMRRDANDWKILALLASGDRPAALKTLRETTPTGTPAADRRHRYLLQRWSATAESSPTAPTPSTEPASTEPATTEPATTEPATTEPATTEPAAATENSSEQN